jgi:hypothetical protein
MVNSGLSFYGYVGGEVSILSLCSRRSNVCINQLHFLSYCFVYGGKFSLLGYVYFLSNLVPLYFVSSIIWTLFCMYVVSFFLLQEKTKSIVSVLTCRGNHQVK